MRASFFNGLSGIPENPFFQTPIWQHLPCGGCTSPNDVRDFFHIRDLFEDILLSRPHPHPIHFERHLLYNPRHLVPRQQQARRFMHTFVFRCVLAFSVPFYFYFLFLILDFLLASFLCPFPLCLPISFFVLPCLVVHILSHVFVSLSLS